MNEEYSGCDRRIFLKYSLGSFLTLAAGCSNSSDYRETDDNSNTYALLVGGERDEPLDTFYRMLRTQDRETLLTLFSGEAGLSQKEKEIKLAEDRFFCTISDIYSSLLKANVPQDQIRVLYGDGKIDVNNTLRPESHALTEELVQPVSKKSVFKALQELQSTIGPNDRLIVVLATHGEYDDGHSYIRLSTPDGSHEELTDKEFHTSMSRIRGKKLLVVDACYSGNFAYEELVGDNTVVMTSTDTKNAGVMTNRDSFSREIFKEFGKPLQDVFEEVSQRTVFVPDVPNPIPSDVFPGERTYGSMGPQLFSNSDTLLDDIFRD